MKKTLYIFLSLIFFLSVSSCTDDFPLGDYEIGEGEAVLSATVNFHPLVGTKVDTGQGGRAAAGDALNDIDNITVFVYKEDGHLFDIYNGADLMDLKTMRKDTEGANTDMPSDAGEKAEETTSRATFTLKGIPFGKYNIYVTANIPFDKKQAKTDFENVKDLKKYTVEWNEKNIAANDQMFGYFSETGESDGFDAYPVVVNKKQMEIHAWIKRAASKVTVVFDGSGLHNGVFIYVKDVRIKDIPKYCRIGEDNRVWTEKGGKDSLINEGDVIYYNTDGLTETDPGEDYLKWLQINKGNGLRGAVSKDPETGVVTEHSEYDKALYFYENIQGNYPGQKEYCKHQDWDKVGYIPKPGDDDYKDNIPYGTYIEVEAYYVSENPENVSRGKIIYRFMLGQDVDYNYNAIRNHHYKLTLGFKGWANQPDWHIAYIEPSRTIFTDPTYYVSYMYNQKSIFPIRILGNVKELEIEIVENNWAPYDSTQTDNVPKTTIPSTVPGELDFEWNKTAYETESYYYGLKTPWNIKGTKQESYSEAEIKKGAPEKVTAIWAGFLALQVPGNKPEDIKATLMNYNAKAVYYSNKDSVQKFKEYYYDYDGKGNGQNYRKFSEADLTFTGSEKVIGSGNNACKVTKAPDGSVTVNLPMWTRPKTMLNISGFSGNNPYDTYQRKAIVRITAIYEDGKRVTRYRPVFQVRRIVNPKAVWRRWNDNSSFKVSLLRREGAAASTFSTFDSEGAWRAHVKTFSPGAEGFISLSGGNAGIDPETGGVLGKTGTPIEFSIDFNGSGTKDNSLCAIVEIEYHGFTCKHTIYVRQGYFKPLALVDGGAEWSSFSLFRTYKEKDPNTGELKGFIDFGTQWNSSKKNYIPAVLTSNPLTLGTLFKRGNYNGILIENNGVKGLGPREDPGQNTTFKMSNGDELDWAHIQGYPFSPGYTGNPYSSSKIQYKYTWGRFSAEIGDESRHYRVPNYNDYNALQNQCEYGIGVMYGDGATTTATRVLDAFGFEDTDNDGDDNIEDKDCQVSSRGMRGIIVYNPSNANQIFFPIGARGIGRRTITGFNSTSWGRFGALRYGGVTYLLTGVTNGYRPITYNVRGNPGAIYWIEKQYDGYYVAWDMNYFDLNFNAYDYGAARAGDYTDWSGLGADWAATHGGDALPIKLVIDKSK